MKIINGLEIFSILATANASYALSNIIYKDCDTLTSVVFVIVGITFSIAYLRGVIDHIKRRESSVALIFAMLPFVISWVLIAPTMNKIYLKSYVGEVSVQEKTDTSDIELKIELKEAEIKKIDIVDASNTVYSFKAQRDDFISSRSSYWYSMRSEWISQGRDRNHPYWLAVLSYGRDRIGSGKMAILNLSKRDYRDELERIKISSNDENKRILKEKENAKKTLEIELSILEKKLEVINKKNNEIKSVKSNAKLSEDDFYLIMFLFGVFLEVFVTLASYWFRPKMAKEVKKAILKDAYSNISIEEFVVSVKENPIIVKEIFPNVANYKLNIVQALIRSWHQNKRTERYVEAFNLFVNPSTGDTYSFSSSFRKVRKELADYGLDFKDDMSNFTTKNLFDAIEKL